MKNNQRNLTGNDKIEFLVLSIEACNCLYQNNKSY